MLNPKYQKCADRLKQLIAKGEDLKANLAKTSKGSLYVSDYEAHSAWITNVEQILRYTFTDAGIHVRNFEKAPRHDGETPLLEILGVLKAALSDLEGGFIRGQEVAIASEIFGSILEQAKHLNSLTYKDAAAMLGRTVIEDALKRLAREEGINDAQKAALLNDQLRLAGRYPLLMGRQVTAWLDIGNSAAHGRFNEYTQEQVALMLEGTELFLGTYFT